MPWIDVSFVTIDPSVAGEDFIVIRRAQNVNDHGETIIRNMVFPTLGSVTPVGDNSLLREDAFQTQTKTLRVITTFRLQGQSRGLSGIQYQPDLIYWNGDYYIVRTLADYSSYGVGLVDAECTGYDYNDLPPYLLPGKMSAAVFSSQYNSGLVPCFSM